MNCKTQGPAPMNAAAWAKLSDCERLDVVEFALLQLAAGNKKVQVRHGDFWVEYSQGSVTYLERQVKLLEARCGRRKPTPRANIVFTRSKVWPC